MCELPVEQESYDVMWSEDAFSHVPRRRQLLQLCRSNLKPGGWLIFSDLIRRGDISEEELDEQCWAWRLWNPESFESYRDLINTVGFDVAASAKNLGPALVAEHIRADMDRGDRSPSEYRLLMKSSARMLIDKWGASLYKERLARLKTYEHLEKGTLDYAFFACKSVL
jgi:SAM-dependent methyltransferase